MSSPSTPTLPLGTAGTAGVLALRAQRVPIRRLYLREQVVLSMWFVPGLFVVGAFGLSFLTVWIG